MVISEPIVNLDNIERYRDEKFDFKSRFGMDQEQPDFLHQKRVKSGLSNDNYKRVEKL